MKTVIPNELLFKFRHFLTATPLLSRSKKRKTTETALNIFIKLNCPEKIVLEISNSTLKITPSVGDFYFFPNYMMHTVYPFSGTDEERRSISFNAEVDSSVSNVYGR